MLFLKRGLMAAGALALAAMILNFVAPKSVHAAVATLVQVVNTTATPVPTLDVESAGRNAMVFSCDGPSICVAGPIPPSKTFVLDSISVFESGALLEMYTTLTLGYGGTVNYALPLTNVPISPYAVAAFNFTAYAEGLSLLQIMDPRASSIHAVFSGHLVPSSTL